MKRALLVGVTNEEPDHPLQPGPSIAAMTALLEDLGGWSITQHMGPEASRESVLRTLEEWTQACGPNDTCLFYFFGHGGVVRFRALSGPFGTRPVFYLATSRPHRPSTFMGLLDVELSSALSGLDRICGNVTAILDCCHAASVVRESEIPTIDPPAWLSELAAGENDRDHLLAAEGHPRIVRLAAASSLRHAYPRRHANGNLGMLTGAFIDVLRGGDFRCDSMTWDAVAHRVREQVSQEHGTEDQRVVLAGPRQRLVFSRRAVELPRSACFVPSAERGHGWLRVGILQGVEVGDRWGVADLLLNEELEPTMVAEVEVRRVQLDRSEGVLVSNADVDIAVGSSAFLRRSEERYPVCVEATPSVVQMASRSGLLRVSRASEAEVTVRIHNATPTSRAISLFDRDGEEIYRTAELGQVGAAEMVALLEDRARAQRLLESLETHAPSMQRDAPLGWKWERCHDDGRFIEILGARSPESQPRLHVGDHVRIQVSHHGDLPPRWFVCAIDIGAAGRPSLINVREPEGVEVIPSEVVYIADRGHRRRCGIQVRWPEGVPRCQPRAATLLLLASRRPIALGHVVCTPDPDDASGFWAQGLVNADRDASRGARVKRPALSRGWTWKRIDFVLDPTPRPTEVIL